jgi:hypothetical protein
VRATATDDDQAATTVARPRWWREVIVLSLAYELYREARIWVTGSEARATANALSLVRVERRLGLFVEPWTQRQLLPHPLTLRLADAYYGTVHFVVPLAVLVWLWWRHPERYRRWRTIFGILLALGIVGFALYPLLPPRLLPAHFGLVDTAVRFGGFGSFGAPDPNPGNPFAAMPSLHIGWSSWCAAAAVPAVRRWWVRALLVLYPCVTLLAIVASANHYVLDAVGGIAALATAWWIERGVRSLRDRRRQESDICP